jgi:biofilm PGA synthesis protein PgaA
MQQIAEQYIAIQENRDYLKDVPADIKKIKPYLTPAVPIILALVMVLEVDSWASELIYTIQTGSYVGENDARRYYESVEEKLNEHELDYLRIEEIGKFYAVRLGRFENYSQANKLLEAVKPRLSSAILMDAYIKNERIVRLYSGAKPADEPGVNEEALAGPAEEKAEAPVTGLVYTLQAESFIGENDARKYFESVKEQLDKKDLDYLRIEKIGKYYAVRLGRFENYAKADSLRQSVRPALPSATILEAYIKNERLVTIYQATKHVVLSRGVKASEVREEKIMRIKSESDSYSQTVGMAQEMVRTARNEEALALLEPFISDPSKYPIAVSDYIVILVWEERYREAIQIYESLSESFLKRDYLLKNIAKAYYEEISYPKAASIYERVLKKTPSDKEVQKGVVYSLMSMYEYDRALDKVSVFLAQSPDLRELAFARAELLLRKRKYIEALRQYHLLGQRNDVDSENIYRLRDHLLASLTESERRDMISELSGSPQTGDREILRDYVRVLILNKDFNSALAAIEAAGNDVSNYPVELKSWIAWVYFKAGNTGKAKLIYNDILADNSDDITAKIGLSYCLSKEGQGHEALKILDPLLSQNSQNLKAIFARAFAFEQMGRFWSAVEEYDAILTIDPESSAAKRLRLMALSDIGASTHAGEGAYIEFPADMELHETFTGDMATDRINWKEFPVALDTLQPQVEDKKNLRARYDYIIALVESFEMQKAAEEYELLVDENVAAPEWVLENVASSYLYLEKPHKALEIYNAVLEKNPKSFNSRMGKFYVLQELRKWEEAREVLAAVDSDEPPYFQKGKNRSPNWKKLDVATAKGWFLAYEDRLRESGEYFWDLHEKAPENTNIRSGLAHTYLWRGWPRKALEEFRISENLDPKDKSAQIGKIQALNELAFKKKSRELAAKLLAQRPKDKHVKHLVRQLELEEMTELTADFTIGSDDDGFEEIMGKVALTRPITLYTQLYGYLLWKTASEEEEDRKTVYRRAGAGVGHTLNSYLQFKQLFSFNYNNGNDFGSYSEIYYTPDDYWEVTLSYDSFSTDMPLRARVFNIEADMLNLDLAYVESDWRTYSLSLSRQEFSDSNERLQALLGYEQYLWVRNNWQERIFLDFGFSSNSLGDAPYFNPDNDFSFSVTHMTEHTVKRIYREAFVYRLYLTAGGYKQDGFSLGPLGSVRYEHDIEMSDTNALLYGVTVGSHPYDGESVTNYGFYLRWRLLF